MRSLAATASISLGLFVGLALTAPACGDDGGDPPTTTSSSSTSSGGGGTGGEGTGGSDGGGGGTPSGPQVVDCTSDEAWQNTLFCAGRESESAVTYERVTEGDATGGNLSARMLYTYPSFEAEAADAFPQAGQARCVDGSEPFLWMDQAQVADPSGVHSWVIGFQGGGSCFGSEPAGGLFNCYEKYLVGADQVSNEMTSDTSRTGPDGRPYRTIGFGQGVGGGIFDRAGVFADHHRVKIAKCAYDRYIGARPDSLPIAGYEPVSAFHQGALVAQATLDLLAAGPTPYQSCLSEPCAEQTVPRLCEAGVPDRVVFVGHSGGAHGLYFNLYRLRDHLEALGCDFSGEDEIYAVFDAQFLPMVEAECGNDPAGCDCGPAPDSLYCGDTSGNSTSLMTSYDEDYYADDSNPSPYRQSFIDWDRLDSLDPQCMAAHAADPWRCLDRFHVMANHFGEIPFVVRESLGDSNAEHHPPGGHATLWANDPGGQWNVGGNWDPAGIPRVDDLAGYGNRIIAQAEHIRDNHATRAEAPLAPFLFYLPRCTQHAGIYNDDTFGAFEINDADATLPFEMTPYDQVIRGFIDDVSGGTPHRLVLTDDGSAGDASNCPAGGGD